jgi:aminoglycoside phosphotransferase (APT) family kinase protein
MSIAALKESIESTLAGQGGEERVLSLERLAGGASRSIYQLALGAEGGADERSLVVRMDADPGRISGSGVDEYDVLSLAYDAGVTVPRVHWRGEFEAGGDRRTYVVMDRVSGEAIARRLLRDDAYADTRRVLPEQLAGELAKIHSIAADDPRLGSLEKQRLADEGEGFATAEVRRYRELLKFASDGHPMPVLVYAGRWLSRNVPVAPRTSLVHGDFRIGNVMFDEKGLAAVLDWELAHMGDPVEDIGWFFVRAWRFGANDLAAGGLSSREAFLQAYERAGGVSVDRDAVRYWEIFGNWKWAVICVLQAAGYKASGKPDVELAAIGRRVAETEREALALLASADAKGD